MSFCTKVRFLSTLSTRAGSPNSSSPAQSEVIDGRPSDLIAVGVGVQSEKVLGKRVIACRPSVRTAANGGEQFINGGAQPLRHLIEEIVGE